MTFHKEGYPTLILTLVFGTAIILFSRSFAPDWLFYIMLTVVLLILLVVIQFFRSPNRKLDSTDDNIIYAPADGKVVVIEEATETEILKDKRIQVSIFMSPINVHVNRYPINGNVSYSKLHKGKYLVAWHPKSSTENERSTVCIEQGSRKLVMRQIAGALARRIVNYAKIGDEATQGQEMGFIKFGSRVDLYLPTDAEILVGIDEVVKGNRTVIGRFN